jgi:hypothetical protein
MAAIMPPPAPKWQLNGGVAGKFSSHAQDAMLQCETNRELPTPTYCFC